MAEEWSPEKQARFHKFLVQKGKERGYDAEKAQRFASYGMKKRGLNYTPPSNDGITGAYMAASEGIHQAGKKAFEYGVRGLDYLGGMGRVAGGGLYDIQAAIRGEPTLSREGDVTRALKGEAPMGAEYLERAGVPKGASLSEIIPSLYSETGEGLPLKRGGALDISGRGVKGFGLDLAADIATTGGLATLGKMALKETSKWGAKKMFIEGAQKGQAAMNLGVDKAAKAVADSTEAALTGIGNYATRSGTKNVDEILRQKGKRPLGDILIEENIWGSSRAINDRLGGLESAARAKRDDLYATATERGAFVDRKKVLNEFSEYTNTVRNATRTPADKKLAKDMEAWAESHMPVTEVKLPGDVPAQYLPQKQIPLEQASTIKTRLRGNMPQSFFHPGTPHLTPSAKEAKGVLSHIYQKEIVKSADNVAPGVGQAIDEVNQKWGALLQAKDPLSREARRETRVNWFTPVDAMTAGASKLATGSTEGAIGMLGLKKAADVAKTPLVRTGVGAGLRTTGRAVGGAGRAAAPYAPIPVRRGVINMEKKDDEPKYGRVSAWQSVMGK